uniref:Uncharacterized protein n=1 Tax=Aegilops tauschii subsp. strangulata TaxID=200361 RepID=A0A453N298_AEGTS
MNTALYSEVNFLAYDYLPCCIGGEGFVCRISCMRVFVEFLPGFELSIWSLNLLSCD